MLMVLVPTFGLVFFPPYCHFHMQVFRAGEGECELTSHVLQPNMIQAEKAFAHEVRKCSKAIYHVVASFYSSENWRVAEE